MTALVCSAPGKVFLGGEYAVLEGAEAVVAAVDRRASAREVDKSDRPSPIVRAVMDEVQAFLGEGRTAAGELPGVEVKSARFHIRKKKIGLGSSAAVTAAATGAYFELAGRPIADHRSDVLTTATAAHKNIQEGRGSGADVAAAVYGGIIVFAMNREVEPITLKAVNIAVVWSGRAASTQALIDQMQEFAKRDPAAHRARFDELMRLAAELAGAYRTDDPKRIIAASADYGRSMDELGRASGASIVTNEHRLISRLAADVGGSAKPSGAGGGDIAVAVLPDSDSMREFRKNCLRHELVPLDIALGAEGLRRDA